MSTDLVVFNMEFVHSGDIRYKFYKNSITFFSKNILKPNFWSMGLVSRVSTICVFLSINIYQKKIESMYLAKVVFLVTIISKNICYEFWSMFLVRLISTIFISFFIKLYYKKCVSLFLVKVLYLVTICYKNTTEKFGSISICFRLGYLLHYHNNIF